MIALRLAHERGHANHGWLDSYHTFSFADYYDPKHMGVSILRVINDDRVAPSSGFDTHPHRNMEIITYVLTGAIEHKDSMGSHSILKAGEVQVMSAGTGVAHSEYNATDDQPLHLLQVWINPDTLGLVPSYDQKDFSDAHGLTLVVSPDGREGSLQISQNAFIYKVFLNKEIIRHPVPPGRTLYLHVAGGSLELNGVQMQEGDGATIQEEASIELVAEGQVEALLFDLP